MLVLIIVGVLAILMAVGLIMDARSRRIRGHVADVHVSDGEASNRDGLVATAELTRIDGTAELARVDAPYIAEARATAEKRPTAD